MTYTRGLMVNSIQLPSISNPILFHSPCQTTITVSVWLRLHGLNWKEGENTLTHWGLATHIWLSVIEPPLVQIMACRLVGSNPFLNQCVNILIGPLGTNFSEILIEFFSFSFNDFWNYGLSAKRRPFCLSLNVLTTCVILVSRSDIKCNYIYL